MNELTGQHAVVTGAGRGIGRGIARALAGAGAAVHCLSRSEEELAQTVHQIRSEGGSAEYSCLDITEEKRVADTVETIERKHGAIDLWVNNAGRFHSIGPAWEVDPDDWWQDVTVNIYGTFLCTRSVIPHMLKQGKGRIINLVGGGTAAPLKYGSGYGSSKAAVARFTETVAWELRETPVKIFAMGPGLVRTAMTQYQLDSEAGQKYLGRIGQLFEKGADVPPSEAGRVAVFLAGGKADSLSGHIFGVHDDLDQLVAEEERVRREERHLLRLPTLRRP